MTSPRECQPVSRDDVFAGLKFLIQYRSKAEGVCWHNMAAFDVLGVSEKYLKDQRNDADWPWEYQLVDLEDGTVTRQEPQP